MLSSIECSRLHAAVNDVRIRKAWTYAAITSFSGETLSRTSRAKPSTVHPVTLLHLPARMSSRPFEEPFNQGRDKTPIESTRCARALLVVNFLHSLQGVGFFGQFVRSKPHYTREAQRIPAIMPVRLHDVIECDL